MKLFIADTIKLKQGLKKVNKKSPKKKQLWSGNLIKIIHAWAISFVRYSDQLLNWIIQTDGLNIQGN